MKVRISETLLLSCYTERFSDGKRTAENPNLTDIHS
jgi:hypothetical protein